MSALGTTTRNGVARRALHTRERRGDTAHHDGWRKPHIHNAAPACRPRRARRAAAARLAAQRPSRGRPSSPSREHEPHRQASRRGGRQPQDEVGQPARRRRYLGGRHEAGMVQGSGRAARPSGRAQRPRRPRPATRAAATHTPRPSLSRSPVRRVSNAVAVSVVSVARMGSDVAGFLPNLRPWWGALALASGPAYQAAARTRHARAHPHRNSASNASVTAPVAGSSSPCRRRASGRGLQGARRGGGRRGRARAPARAPASTPPRPPHLQPHGPDRDVREGQPQQRRAHALLARWECEAQARRRDLGAARRHRRAGPAAARRRCSVGCGAADERDGARLRRSGAGRGQRREGRCRPNAHSPGCRARAPAARAPWARRSERTATSLSRLCSGRRAAAAPRAARRAAPACPARPQRVPSRPRPPFAWPSCARHGVRARARWVCGAERRVRG